MQPELEIRDLTACLDFAGYEIPEVGKESPKITLFAYLRTMFEQNVLCGEDYLAYLHLLVAIPSPSPREQ